MGVSSNRGPLLRLLVSFWLAFRTLQKGHRLLNNLEAKAVSHVLSPCISATKFVIFVSRLAVNGRIRTAWCLCKSCQTPNAFCIVAVQLLEHLNPQTAANSLQKSFSKLILKKNVCREHTLVYRLAMISFAYALSPTMKQVGRLRAPLITETLVANSCLGWTWWLSGCFLASTGNMPHPSVSLPLPQPCLTTRRITA